MDPMPTPLPKQTPPATSADAPPVGVPDPGAAPTALPNAGPAARPAAPVGSQPTADPNAIPGSVEPHHGTLASIFQDLAGGQKTTYRQTENGPVAVKENLAPGEMARGIVAAALTGLAAGYGTHGGAGKAISAGFNAETEQRTQNAEQAKSQAQEQFKNQQTADELTMRKQQNAREQQKSIQDAQEHDMRMQKFQSDFEQGKITNAQELVKFQDQQMDRMMKMTELGIKPLAYPDGKPVEEFNSPADAMDWSNKNAALAIQPGKYNTMVAVDPHTNRYVIMQKPLSWDDQQWLGVKTKDGVPIKDKDGNFVPDGSFKDMHGKVVAPAGQMTPHQMYDSQIRLIEMRDKELTLEESLERLRTARMARVKDEQQNKADDEFNRAGGNPDAIDPKTHDFIVSPSSRTILQQRFIKDAAMEGTVIAASQKALETLDPKDPEFGEVKQQLEEARGVFHSTQANMLMLSRTPNVADIMAGTYKTEYTKPDGHFDEDAFNKDIDSTNMPSGQKQSIREKVLAGPPSVLDNPTNLQSAVDHANDLIKKGRTFDDVLAEINQSTTFSKADKTKLIGALRPVGSPTPTPAAHTLAEALAAHPVPPEKKTAMEGMTR